MGHRYIDLKKKFRFSSKDFSTLFDLLSIDYEIENLNTKLNREDYSFLEEYISSSEYKAYSKLRRDLILIPYEIIKKTYGKFLKSDPLCTFEKRQLMQYLIRKHNWFPRVFDDTNYSIVTTHEKEYLKKQKEQMDNENVKKKPPSRQYTGETCPACGSQEYMCCNYWIEQNT